MVFASKPMKARGDDFPASHQHCTDHRIRTRPTRSFEGKTTSHTEVTFIQIRPGLVGQMNYSLLGRVEFVVGTLFRSLMSSSNSTMNSLMSLKER